MKPSVSAVIATIGRPSLSRAVQSALDQTYPVGEIIVVAEADTQVFLPADDRIVLLRSSDGGGAARSRQVGIDAAHGSIIALLDDDDVWQPTKLARQLAAAEAFDNDHWIVSSRMLVLGPGARQRIWPRRLIDPGELVAEYLFRFNRLGFGNGNLQTSTLCFPAALGRSVRWGGPSDEPHDEPSWLIRVQRSIPDLRVVQLWEPLSTYNVHGPSVSRDLSDRTDAYIHWGLRYLGSESPRLLGDYLCTSPVSAAVSARSLSGVRHAVWSAVRNGRPGPLALAYAALNAVRVIVRIAVSAIRR
ncbi:glycosyltransferase involved in cell wall biosynthesis [Mycobacterium frederiksbergense]|uniref:Glycosyltransferase involved in cell wall biosynthesis n=1 Tax=Mycolicibacterium frederiksbergense TaxID=117567 RepID=A0ABT6L1Q6_9MYCO|nr:glycosyltransferase family A protein [Mycolicibacterium frederiksbergense]MDH6196210.1 glycosyltransferase involved in cell wall biosynthesis [Mycolicibacterium frederiksbergense]